MRLFVVLRSVFFLVLLTASSVFVLHSKLCINYVPHELDEFVTNCRSAFYSISKVRHDDPDEKPSNISSATKTLLNSATELDFEAENLTLIEMRNYTMIEKFHRIDIENQVITVNAKTCFDFSLKEILSDAVPQYTTIVSPIRLTLILIVTSFLVAILDMSLRMFNHQLSLIQCLTHTFVQNALWGTILVSMEMYRRGWMENWIASGQTVQEIPMYPSEWTNFEVYAFVMMLLSIMDSVLFEYLSKRIVLANSQGVYKCIEPL